LYVNPSGLKDGIPERCGAVQSELGSLGGKRRFKPWCGKVEKGDYKYEEEERAVDAWPVEEVGCAYEKDEVYGRGIGP
jgi:hypothetical protein